MTQQRYTVTAWNSQGATDRFTGTRKEVDAWARLWDRPESLTMEVRDDDGFDVGLKVVGRKRIVWSDAVKRRGPGRPKTGQPRKDVINICLSRDVVAMADVEAERLGISRSALISQLILERAHAVTLSSGT